ncbi:DHH family phosphoesterase [Ornithinibacillus halophilus]|uniref:Phosphoesterase RecJ domain-containing protein n=1 Tax=Ornithinibacillus halophilus TaxID=930117 RepID=A0A1M5EH03_9BACI|nr:bifunctional oligoribonuclease/PAP phosphatase NrnA [Ornithinibacillus halophilus]SHF78528.1 phosphoesterase RecJ domain-containing protein [Ornithinibacillus halophilus]
MAVKEIIQEIKDNDVIIIHRHVRPDPDALGSQAGLRAIIKQSFPEKQVYVVGDEDPSLEFLVRMDEVEDSLYQDALVIVCDTANTARVDDGRYDQGKKLIKIDHHPNVDPYGDISWVNTNASSCSEMIYELYVEAKEHGFVMNDEAARLLYGGIVGDTGRFLFPSTTKKTLQYAADLVTYDFDRTSLYDGMYSVKHNIARLRGYILQNFTLTADGMSSIKLTKELLDEYGVDSIQSGQLVGVLGDIEGIKSWVFFIEEDDQIRVRLRSKGPVINDLAAKYNGGGHPMAAGASVYSWEETESVISDLEEICKNYTDK